MDWKYLGVCVVLVITLIGVAVALAFDRDELRADLAVANAKIRTFENANAYMIVGDAAGEGVAKSVVTFDYPHDNNVVEVRDGADVIARLVVSGQYGLDVELGRDVAVGATEESDEK